MLFRLISGELRHRPGRSALLLSGYALGVAVMVVLLAVGEAMLAQSRDRGLLGGGDLLMVPAGVSTEVIRAGGPGTLFIGLDRARFLQRVLLESERAREEYGIVAASPVLDDRRLELEAGGRRFVGLATGEIPGRAAAVGGDVPLIAGRWDDDPASRRFVEPTPAELYREMDTFHLPTGEAARDSTWAEWHYFNVVLSEDRWLYLTLAVGGALATEAGWGGQLLLTVREPEGHRAVTRSWPAAEVAFDTASPDLRFGVDASVTVTDEGRYRVTAEAEGHRLDFELAPSPGRYLPPTDLGGEDLISGYVAPVLHGRVDGTLCLPACEEVTGATGYHDHNWGVWRDVSWEWGAASDERTSLLYGMVRPPEGGEESLFVYLVDERGPVGIYRPGEMRTLETERRTIDGIALDVPVRLGFEDPRRGLSVEIEVTAVNVTDMDRERRPYFLQMRGVATVRSPGRVDRLPGFFETYLERY
jgi:hypothetical protein